LKSSDLAIRRLDRDDAADYRALRLRGLREHPDAFTSSYEEAVEKPFASTVERLHPDGLEAVYGAFGGGKLYGVVGLAREARTKNQHKATVFGMYVAPEHLRRGVGSALLRHLVDEAKRQPGIAQLVLTVTATNVAATALYEAFGFRSFGIEPRAIRVDDAYFDKNHMILFLAEP